MPGGLSSSDFYYILPELVLTAGALILLIADVLLSFGRLKAAPSPVEGLSRLGRPSTGLGTAASWSKSRALAVVTLVAIGATLASLGWFTRTHVEVAHGLLAVDRFSLFIKIMFLVAAALTVLMSTRYLDIEGASPGSTTS